MLNFRQIEYLNCIWKELEGGVCDLIKFIMENSQ